MKKSVAAGTRPWPVLFLLGAQTNDILNIVIASEAI